MLTYAYECAGIVVLFSCLSCMFLLESYLLSEVVLFLLSCLLRLVLAQCAQVSLSMINISKFSY